MHQKQSGAENCDCERCKGTEELLKTYTDVFPEKLPPGLPAKWNAEMSIKLEEGAKPKIGPIYKLSVTELAEMKKQIEEALANGFIRPSVSPGGKSCLIRKEKKMEVSECV